MEGLRNMLEVIGAVFMGSCGIALIVWFGIWFKRLCRVVHDYHVSAPTLDDVRPWGETNYFTRLQNGINETKNRLYIAERNGSNAIYRIGEHVKDNKHTKTAKAIKRDKKRKAVEEGSRNDRDFSGTDGM